MSTEIYCFQNRPNSSGQRSTHRNYSTSGDTGKPSVLPDGWWKHWQSTRIQFTWCVVRCLTYSAIIGGFKALEGTTQPTAEGAPQPTAGGAQQTKHGKQTCPRRARLDGSDPHQFMISRRHLSCWFLTQSRKSSVDTFQLFLDFFWVLTALYFLHKSRTAVCAAAR